MEIFNNKTGLGFIQKDTTSFYTLVQIMLYYICKLKKDVIMLSWNLQKKYLRYFQVVNLTSVYDCQCRTNSGLIPEKKITL